MYASICTPINDATDTTLVSTSTAMEDIGQLTRRIALIEEVKGHV